VGRGIEIRENLRLSQKRAEDLKYPPQLDKKLVYGWDLDKGSDEKMIEIIRDIKTA
jgi:hypothetical protein